MTDYGARVDLHVKVLDERVVRRAKARGLDALVYAPHFTRLPDIETRAARYSDGELSVIPAREIFTGDWRTRKHVLGLDLSDPIPDFITLEGAIAELERQDAAILVPHPSFLTVSLTAADIDHYRDAIHAVETFNPKHLPHHNRRARAIARSVDRPVFASSYAHLRGTVGEAWTEFPDLEPTGEELVEALKRRGDRSIGRQTGIRHGIHRALEMAHLGYENTVQKVDRVVLGGREATHPDHPAYAGRFDDVAVYQREG
ncbi:MAG: PHP-associated domain-containing protein [Halobacteriales archaeon]|nr:PHP-associated domain-containing protein [Halobacteriales archaeon]